MINNNGIPNYSLPPLEDFDENPADDHVADDFDDTVDGDEVSDDEGDADSEGQSKPKAKKKRSAQSRISKLTWEKNEATRNTQRVETQLTTQINALQQQITALTSNQQQQVTQAELNTAKEGLKEAFESGDYDKAAEISLKLGKLANSVPSNNQAPPAAQAPAQKTPLDMYMESKHTWFNKDPLMTKQTIDMFNAYSVDARYQNKDQYELLDLISKNVVAEEYKRGKTSFAPNPGMNGSSNYTGPNDDNKTVSKKEIEQARYQMPTLSDEKIKSVILRARARNK